mgnify:CR=1 FL=1
MLIECVFFLIFSLPSIPLPSTIFTKMFTGCSTCIFRYQWHGSCKLEHRHRMSYAQLCDDRSDMGNLKSVSRLDAFNYIPIYIQCKKSLPKYHSYFLPFKTKTFERVTLFLKSYLFYKLVLIWSGHPHLPWRFKSWAGKLLKIWDSNPPYGTSNFVLSFFCSFSHTW